MLKPALPTSMARTSILLDTPCPFTKVNCQQVPHPAELNPVTAGAPPMFGKLGNDPKVVNPRVIKPLEPSEHATVSSDPAALSYVLSKLTVKAKERAGRKARGAKMVVNFILGDK